ncbi:MAG TPA: hypothetical protein VML94_04365 [Thermoplasmata archaeon]|nr:hypothetical protein [Thermoplasmata archaeon]
MSPPEPGPSSDDRLRDTEAVLRRLGYARVAPERKPGEPEASFWVQEAGVPRRTYPVYVPSGERASVGDRIDRWLALSRGSAAARRRAIFVAPNDNAADEAWTHLAGPDEPAIEHEVAILVVPPESVVEPAPHFHLRKVHPREVLRVATGVVVGLFRRSQASEGSAQIDFEEMLGLLRRRFGIDVLGSLGVRSDEDALFLLYQLAHRDSYAPGDPGANVHLLVLRPTGPAARLPWFAA